MIEKMKLVHIVTSASRKEEMLDGLREVGLMHLAEKQNADRNISEQFQTLSKTANALKEYADPKAKEKAPILSDEEFAGMYREVLDALEQKAALSQTIGAANTELDRISAWGDFSPQEVKKLKEEGFDFHFYRLGAKELQDALNDENIRLIRLSSVDKMDTVAVIGTLPPTIPATEFVLPEKSVSELKEQIEACTKEIAVCDEKLRKASVYEDSFNDQMLKARNDMNYSAASATAQSDEDFVWLTGYEASDFFWGCNSEGAAWRGTEMAYAAQLTGDKTYTTAAQECLNYLLGQNATGYCYVTGFGTHPAQHPHHRLATSPCGALPGFLVGGPNPGQQDKGDNLRYTSDFADESYMDDQNSYASNEIAINWNATLVTLTGMLDQ